jgi:hypothetical protein
VLALLFFVAPGSIIDVPDDWKAEVVALYEMADGNVDCIPWEWCNKPCRPKIRFGPGSELYGSADAPWKVKRREDHLIG